MDTDLEHASEDGTDYGYDQQSSYDSAPDGSGGDASAEGGYDHLAWVGHGTGDDFGLGTGEGGYAYGDGGAEADFEGITSKDIGRIGKGAVIAGVAIETVAPATGPLYPIVAVAGAAVLLTGLVEEWIADENPDVEPLPAPTVDIPSHEETTLRSSSVGHEDPPPPAAHPNSASGG